MSSYAAYADFAHAYEGREREAAAVKKQETLAFAHALVALAAKLVACDGTPTTAEYLAFQSLFIEGGDADAGKLKNLFVKHTQDDSSALQYARQIAAATPGQSKLHAELLSRLLRVANADATLNAAELEFLRVVAKAFGITGEAFRELIAQAIVPTGSPYDVLGITADASDDDIREAYMSKVFRLHPDRYQAAGASDETVSMLTDQLAALNAAYEAVKHARTKKYVPSNWGRKHNKGANTEASRL